MDNSYLLPADINNLILNQNAYFYKAIKQLSKLELLTILQEAVNDKNGTRIYQQQIRVPFVNSGKELAKYSLDIFEFKDKPSFLKETEQGKWEIKFGLFLIVECSGYIALIRRNISGIDTLNQFIENIDYEILSHFLITQQSKVEKIVSNSINTSDIEIQRKVSESKDLKGVYSRFGASKQIINSLRIDNQGRKTSLMLNTSRINSFNIKSSFNEVIYWIVQVVNLIERAYKHLPESSFIDGFAKPIEFESIIDNLEPTYLLLRYGYLLDDIENHNIERCYRQVDSKEENVDLVSFIKKYDQLLILEKINNKEYKNQIGDFCLKINQKSLTILSKEFKQVILDFGNDMKMSLNQYLNSGSHFLVNFDKFEYGYSHRKIFRDSKLLGDLENFFNTFISDPELSLITSEKGENYSESSTEFDDKSLFGYIERKFKNDSDILICDDMGTEWGDYISINNDDVIFIHAKYNKKGLSASDLEVVFGQVQKNLGYLILDNEMIDYREKKWNGNYKAEKQLTGIERIRKCPSGNNKIQIIKDKVSLVSSNANIRRKIYVVINFISKKELIEAVDKLKNGSLFHNKGVTLQIIWFVNSLLTSANELNTELRILCQP